MEKMKRHTNETITITNELKSGMAKVEQFNKNMAYVGVASLYKWCISNYLIA
jgi:hypothetical protein